jgi:hypothetical protein
MQAELQQHDIEETRMERDVSQIAGMGHQVGDMALRTGQQVGRICLEPLR